MKVEGTKMGREEKKCSRIDWEGESDVPGFPLWAAEDGGGGEILSHGDSIRIRNVNRLSQSRAGTVCERRGRQHQPKNYYYFFFLGGWGGSECN